MLYQVTAKLNIFRDLFKQLHPVVKFQILKALALKAGNSSLLGYYAMSTGNKHGIIFQET
jgi:hypothetical protein